MRIAILITCFNRKNLTLTCLQRLSEQTGVEDQQIEVFLVDDGSSDGTWEAVERDFPKVHLIKGSGELFWNGGMHLAFAEAMSQNFDGYIWLNDDTVLHRDALHRLLSVYRACEAEAGPVILVGSLRDETTGEHTYGGISKYVKGLRFELHSVPPDDHAILKCDTVHANFTYVPDAIAKRVGNFDSIFTQKFGDLDYGLRATKLGVPIRVAPGFFGTCDLNLFAVTWRKPSHTLAQRWRHIRSPKGLPVREWLTYVRRHYGWRWPLYAVSPYLKMLFGR